MATTFEHLTPIDQEAEAEAAGHWRLYHCDICMASEVADIIERGTLGTPTPDLIPMYRDARDGLVVCRRCAESGAYLELEAGVAEGR